MINMPFRQHSVNTTPTHAFAKVSCPKQHRCLRPRKYHKLQTHAPVQLSPYLTEISDSQQIC